MGKLKLQMQITVDGFDPDGSNSDVSMNDVKDYSRDLLDSADMIVIGRKTAADFIPYWDEAATNADGSWYEVARRIAAAKKVVFSKSLDRSDWSNTHIENGDLVEGINRLKDTNERDIIVYGGVSFVASLMKERLIDELHLFVSPVARGNGSSIFSGLADVQKLKLIGSSAFASGLVLLKYEAK